MGYAVMAVEIQKPGEEYQIYAEFETWSSASQFEQNGAVGKPAGQCL